jgi:hypothetical protein
MSIGNPRRTATSLGHCHTERRIMAELALLIPVAMLALLVALAALLRN